MLKIFMALGALFALALYLAPTVIACRRNHAHSLPIVGVNILLGWTGLGWFGALLWALWGPKLVRKA